MTKVHTTNQQKKKEEDLHLYTSIFFCWFVVCTFVMKSLPLYPIVPTSFDDQNPHNLRTWSIFLQFCILRSSSLKAVMSKWMKGEAQANAMSVCVCATRQRRSHTGLLSCALMCFLSCVLVCYLSCAVLAITARTSTCRSRVDCTLSIRSLLVLLHTQSESPLYTR